MSNELAVSQDLMFDPANLTKETIKKFLCPLASEQELTFGLQVAKTCQLNPIKKEIYFVKYSANHAMSILTGYEVYLKRASRSSKCTGMRSWTEGSIEQKNLKGMVEVGVKGWDKPLLHEADYNEYVQKKNDGTINKFWSEKPKTMIKKVAISQAFRMAFPDEFDGMPYTQDEMPDQSEPVKIAPVVQKNTVEGVKEAIKAQDAEIVKPTPTPEPQKQAQTPVPATKAPEAAKTTTLTITGVLVGTKPFERTRKLDGKVFTGNEYIINSNELGAIAVSMFGSVEDGIESGCDKATLVKAGRERCVAHPQAVKGIHCMQLTCQTLAVTAEGPSVRFQIRIWIVAELGSGSGLPRPRD